ncbi:MAG: hypothetical protein SH850_06365 [Planctomycetaceae bacterium]|nr:hypothetical protein [Planctomycetaceae bacterium]
MNSTNASRHSLLIVVMKYEAVFLVGYFAFLWIGSRLFGIELQQLLSDFGDEQKGVLLPAVIGFPMIAAGFGAIGLSAAAIHAETGPVSVTHYLAIAFSRGPFQQVLLPTRPAGTILFQSFFLSAYFVLWIIVALQIGQEAYKQWVTTLGFWPIALAVMSAIIPGVLTSLVLLPPMTPEQLQRELRVP